MTDSGQFRTHKGNDDLRGCIGARTSGEGMREGRQRVEQFLMAIRNLLKACEATAKTNARAGWGAG